MTSFSNVLLFTLHTTSFSHSTITTPLLPRIEADMTPKNDAEQAVCSCQVKPYDIEDPSTWVRPKYVTLHDANAKCCKPPSYTVALKEEEEEDSETTSPSISLLQQPNKHSRGDDIFLARSDKPPVPHFSSHDTKTFTTTTKDSNRKEIAPSTFYGSSSSSSTRKLSDRPTLVNGKIFPSRMSAMETQTSKDKKVEKDITPTRDFMFEDKPAAHKTYSRKDRKYRSDRKWAVSVNITFSPFVFLWCGD